MGDYYSELGSLVISSRIRKFADRMLAEIGEVYKTLDVDFEPGWFHVLYLLNQNQEMAITQISETLQVAHPSVIQVVKVMEKRGLVEAFQSKLDKRKRMLKLTEKGQQLVGNVAPVWLKIQHTLDQLLEEGEFGGMLFKAMKEVEENLDHDSLVQRMKKLDNKKRI